MDTNPFTPSFGEVPLHLAGRSDIIRSFERAFESENRKPELTTIFTGARGTGKTSLMAYLADKAEQSNWIVVRTTALPGMMEDVEIQLQRKASHLLKQQPKVSLERIGIPDIISFDISSSTPTSNWRSRMEDMLDQLAEQNIGLVIVVDEVDPSLDEMIQIAAIYQQFVIDKRKVSLIMAGLPHNTSSLITNKTVSFLRRANQIHLLRIEDYEIENALARTVNDGERKIEQEALRLASNAIKGFPFMLQLVGYHAWDENPKEKTISVESLISAVEISRREMESRIFAATYAELSLEDLRFLQAMLEDSGDSTIADITRRLDRSSSQVAQYRKRLIDAGIIGRRARGVIGFDLPFFKEYLQERLEDEGL